MWQVRWRPLLLLLPPLYHPGWIGMDGWVDGLEDADSDAGTVLIRETQRNGLWIQLGNLGGFGIPFFSCALLCLHSATKSPTLKGTLGVREEGFSCYMSILLWPLLFTLIYTSQIQYMYLKCQCFRDIWLIMMGHSETYYYFQTSAWPVLSKLGVILLYCLFHKQIYDLTFCPFIMLL